MSPSRGGKDSVHDRTERPTDLILSVTHEDVRRLYEERALRHDDRATMYDEAASKMEAAAKAAPAEELPSGPTEEGAYLGAHTLAVRESPRQGAAAYRTAARNERRMAAIARLCAKSVQPRDYNLTEEEVSGLHS